MMQKGILLRAANHAISETPVPRPPEDSNAIHTSVFASLLKVRMCRELEWVQLHDDVRCRVVDRT